MIRLYLTKQHIITLIMVMSFLIGIIVLLSYKLMNSPVIVIQSSHQQQIPTANIQHITVHIAGAVKQPGLYDVPLGTMPLDAIALAGGALQNANLDRINLAKPLTPQKRLLIPYKKATRQLRAPLSTININRATQADWMKLPGIGQAKARQIIQHRKTHGPFPSIDALTQVSGISTKTIQKLRPYLRL